MALNENVIKNIANEVTRNAQAANTSVDHDFVIYLIDLLLLNPKYGKLFVKNLNRVKLEYFVKECVDLLTQVVVSTNTLKLQHIMLTHYNTLNNLRDSHIDSIDVCLKPLLLEIINAEPETDEELAKLYRKISIYFIMCCGLGPPNSITNLKEALAAFSSVYSLDDLKIFVNFPNLDKVEHLSELMAIVAGIRLFNRDCKKGGGDIYDLPVSLVEASAGCLTSLTNSLIGTMKRVNTLTTALYDKIVVDDELGTVHFVVPEDHDYTVEDAQYIADLLTFNRQYELFVRKLLSDIGIITQESAKLAENFKLVLGDVHNAVKFKEAVPTAVIYPLFIKLWGVWRSMQVEMFLVSTINKILNALYALQEQCKTPLKTVNKMLNDNPVISDADRMFGKGSNEDKVSLSSMKIGIVHEKDDFSIAVYEKDEKIMFLGFCVVCLSVGALIPGNMKLGNIRYNNKRYRFSNGKAMKKFTMNPERYINEALEFARNHPALVNLLEIIEEVTSVKEIDVLVERKLFKKPVYDKDTQMDLHPIESHIERNYSWNLWEWKRRACQWASIVNCRTHSTQTDYSHLRAEIHCQAAPPKDKCHQTRKDSSVNASLPVKYIWGSKAFSCEDVYYLNVDENYMAKKNPVSVFACEWPCVTAGGPIDRELSAKGENSTDLLADQTSNVIKSYDYN